VENINKYVIVISILFLAIMFVPVLAGDYVWWTDSPTYVWNETSHFDTGFKSNSSSNYDVVTFTDNLHLNENEITLDNLYSDRFTFPDADSDTWKWGGFTTGSTYELITDIDTTVEDTLFMNLTTGTTFYGIVEPLGMRGNFSIIVNFSDLIGTDTGQNQAGMFYSFQPNSTDGLCSISIENNLTADINYQSYGFGGGVGLGKVPTADTSGRFRLIREYNETDCNHTSQYWDTNHWETVLSETVNIAVHTYCNATVWPYIYSYTSPVASNVSANFNNYSITPAEEFEYQTDSCSGTATACAGLDVTACGNQQGCLWIGFCLGTATPCTKDKEFVNNQTACESQDGCSWGNIGYPYKQTGNWTSDLKTCSAPNELTQVRLNISADTYNNVSKLEILDTDENVLYTDDTDQTTDGIKTYSISGVQEDFKVRLFLEGNGTATATVFDVLADVDVYTSLYAVEFNVSDSTISSSDYQQVFAQDFNTTTDENLGLMTSFNLEKSSGGGASTVSAKVMIDGETYLEEDVRTIGGINEQVSVGLTPLLIDLAGGSHNITLDMKRSGNGNIELYNVDFILGKFNTTDNHLVNGTIANLSYTTTSTDWSEGTNLTVVKTIASPTYYGGVIDIESVDTDKLWINLTNINTSESSQNLINGISTTKKRVGLNWLNTNSSETHNITFGTRLRDGDSTTITGAGFAWDLYDDAGDIINHFSSYNGSISEETPMLITGDEYQLVDEEFINNKNGTGLFISSFSSFNTTSDKNTVEFMINVSNSTCPEIHKERYLSSNNAFGDVFTYGICDTDLVIDGNYTVHLWARAGVREATTETVQISTMSLSAMEITNFSLTDLGVPPSISVEEPDEIEYSYNGTIWYNVTTNQDNTDNCWYILDGNTSEQYMTNSSGNWNLFNYTTEGQHFVEFYCNNTDGLIGSTDEIYFYNFINTYPNIINIRHNSLYDYDYNKTLEIQHLWYYTDGTFGGYLNTSYCVVEMTRPDGTEYVNYALVNHSDSIYNLSMNFTGEPTGQWIAGYTCTYNSTMYTGITEPFNLTSDLLITSYNVTTETETIADEYNIMLGVIFIFVGLVFLYMLYMYNLARKRALKIIKRGEYDAD